MNGAKLVNKFIPIVVAISGIVLFFIVSALNFLTLQTLVTVTLLLFSFLLSVQGIFTLCWMLYAWEKSEILKKQKLSKKFAEPKYSFTAILPVRSEESVLEDTIKAVDKINYPNHLKEIVVVLRHDDTRTINKAQEVIAKLGNNNHTVLVLVDSYPINKPVSLNYGLKQARNQIITIFDAEDEPDPEIYNIINSTFVREKVDVVQAGVSLMNYNSQWYSTLNVMEYYFWFKSGLFLINNLLNISLLGGNTVFVRKRLLRVIGGWDENCLTEDADIGIRLTAIGAKTKVVFYDSHSTREETPATIDSFIKQRTRWNQGFLQILTKGDWKKLPTLQQRVLVVYFLVAPYFLLLILIYIPFGVWINLGFDLPVFWTMLSFVPLYILFAIISTQIVGLYEFTKSYGMKYYWYLPVKVLASYFPYNGLLTISAVRALFRFFASNNAWEKTSHLNAHRSVGY